MRERVKIFYFVVTSNSIGVHLIIQFHHSRCSRNAKSQFEPVIEHLVGRQGQARGAQVHVMELSDRKGRSQDPPLPRPHLRVGSGGQIIL